jgi:hypothetical protein
MSDYSRDGNVERQQIHEISLNVARRLLRVLDSGRSAPPALANDIESTSRMISDIQRDVENVMGLQPFGTALEISLLTHILSSQQHAIALLEQLEMRIQSYPQAHSDARQWQQPTPVPRPSSLSGYTPPNGARDWARPQPPMGNPQSFAMPAGPAPYQPAHAAGPAPFANGQRPPAARPQPSGPQSPGSQSPGPQSSGPRSMQSQQRPPSGGRPGVAQTPARARFDFKAFARRMSEPKHAAIAATATVILGSLFLAFILLPGLKPKPSADNVAPGQKLDGRLETAAANESDGAESAAQFSSAAHDPAATEQPYLVVLSTRASTAELQKDFQGFNESYAELLVGRKARVDRIQGQDQKIWHRLSLIPPQSHAEAKDLCAKLRAAGLTGCWIRRVPLSASR